MCWPVRSECSTCGVYGLMVVEHIKCYIMKVLHMVSRWYVAKWLFFKIRFWNKKLVDFTCFSWNSPDLNIDLSRNRWYKHVYGKIIESQHHTPILKANCYLNVYNVNFKLALSADKKFFYHWSSLSLYTIVH